MHCEVQIFAQLGLFSIYFTGYLGTSFKFHNNSFFLSLLSAWTMPLALGLYALGQLEGDLPYDSLALILTGGERMQSEWFFGYTVFSRNVSLRLFYMYVIPQLDTFLML